MYRVNLYPELEGRRQAERDRLRQTIALASLAGLQLLLIGSLLLSGMLLQDRATRLRAENARLASLAHATAQSPEVLVARQLLAARQARVDWSPKLAALGRLVEAPLILSNVIGQADLRGRGARLDVQGRIRSVGQTESVLQLVESLRKDPAMARDFPQVRIGSVSGEESDRFKVVCEPAGKGP